MLACMSSKMIASQELPITLLASIQAHMTLAVQPVYTASMLLWSDSEWKQSRTQCALQDAEIMVLLSFDILQASFY